MAAYSLLDEVWAEPFANPPPEFTLQQQAQPLPQRAQPLTTVENPDLLRSDRIQRQLPTKLIETENVAETSTDELVNRLQQQIAYLENKLKGMAEGSVGAKRQRQMNTNEFLTYIATGAFLIFILDSFLQFGHRLR